ncbi:hypothetical protein [Hymenobacter canadensis]|uniref:Lipoprotein n=1 Tax=Hymenobacter canadensis TaxID=2999067 RepID=A0ABY7LPQ1_9BACT|nr:hypothetical protein [Hymenobacter canadensis]WBA40680.1 hypothetical protein O3303_12700 [Hymenobacter canadensis]
MKTTIRLVASCALLSLLASCGAKDNAEETTAAETTTATTTTETAAAPEAAPETAAPTAPAATFDISTVPVSSANLGQYPYLSGLKDYKVNTSNSEAYEFELAYIFDGQNLVPVEGKVSQRLFDPNDSDQKASELMISRNYAALLQDLSATKVSSAKVPREIIDKVGSEEAYKHGKWSLSTDHVTDTYLIRQKDKEVWVQVTPLGSDGSYNITVAERAAMPQQATVIPAADIKKN